MQIKPKPSWEGLDFVRFVCVAFMVFIHSTFWLIGYSDLTLSPNNFLYPLINRFHLIGLFPLCIPATAGASLRLHFSPYLQNGQLRNYPLSYLAKVSLVIVLLSFLMNILSWGTTARVDWDVLEFIAICYFLTALVLKYANIAMVFAIGIVTFAVTDMLRSFLVDTSWFMPAILVGEPKDGFYWPVFPWYSTFVLGLAVAHAWFAFARKSWFLPALAAMGLLLCVLANITGSELFTIDPDQMWGEEIFKPQVRGVLFVAGTFCLLLLFAELFASRVKFRKYGIVNTFSTGVLWIYLVHEVLGIHLSYLFREIWLPAAALIFPALMLGLSWLTGVATVFLGEKRIHIKLRKTATNGGAK